MRICSVSLALLLAASAPAFAQTGKVTVGINYGVPIPITEGLDEFADQKQAWSGDVTIGLVGALAVRGELGRTEFKPTEEFVDVCNAFLTDCDQTLQITNFSAGIQYGGFGDQGALGLARARVLPYGYVTIGSYKVGGDLVDLAETFCSIFSVDSGLCGFIDDRHFGFSGGAGINIRITDNVGIQIDVRGHGVKLEQESEDLADWTYFVTPSGGLRLTF